MSLAETGPARVTMSRQRFVARLSLLRGLALVLALAPMLAACGSGGIRPLYGATPSGAGLQERLAQLEVATIPGRVGQRIRNDLIFQSSGGGELAPPTHRLEVTITELVISTLVKTDGDALGQTYALVANFKLVEIKSKQIVLTGCQPWPGRVRTFPVDLFQRARARRRREPRGTHRRRGPQDAGSDLPLRPSVAIVYWPDRVSDDPTPSHRAESVLCWVIASLDPTYVPYPWSPSRRTRPTPT